MSIQDLRKWGGMFLHGLADYGLSVAGMPEVIAGLQPLRIEAPATRPAPRREGPGQSGRSGGRPGP